MDNNINAFSTPETLHPNNINDIDVFPNTELRIENRGMSLRDYFAAQCMNAYIMKYGTTHYRTIAHIAYEMADAMLDERTKKT